MKPTNRNENGCDPISSNCVVWQGPDIDCISLCKGDTVSVVVNKLAIELCTLMETFNIDNFDISCFNLAECTPKDFKGLINLLIEKICEDQGVSPETSVGGCPDCVVNTCSEFHYTNPTGDTVTTMQLKDYVLAIGNKVCGLVGQIGTINQTLGSHDTRISDLEQAGTPQFIMPQITPVCVLPVVATNLDTVLIALEDQFCNLRTATGDPTAITTALQAACAGLNQSNQLSGPGTMQQIVGWHAAPQNMSESFSNLWKVICDMRSAVTAIQLNCCDTGCSSINLIVSGTLNSPTELQLDFTGSIPSNYTDQAIGSSFVITDSIGGSQTLANIGIKADHFTPVTPLLIPLTSVNGALDCVVATTYRFIDSITGSTCENIIITTVLGTDTCPNLVIVPSYNQAPLSFTWNGTLGTPVTLELWDAGLTGVLQTVALVITTSNPASIFTGLDEGTTYNVRLVLPSGACEFEDFITLEYPCDAPIVNAPTLDYTDPEGDTLGNTIVGWQGAYDGATHPDTI